MKIWALSFLLAVVLAVRVAEAAPLAEPVVPTERAARTQAATRRLRVLTLNAFIAPFISPNLEGRKRLLPAQISKLEPDVVALQELWNEEDAAEVAAALASVGLPHAHWVAADGRPPFGSAGLMIASRFPLTGARFQRYEAGGTPPVLFHVDWMANKGFLTTRILTPYGPVDVANTHVHAQYDLFDYPAVRLMQLVELTDGLGREESAPLIVAGDLNSTPDSLPVRFLLATQALSPTSDTFDIDLILARDNGALRLAPVETRVVLTEPLTLEDGAVDLLSDHPGILTVFDVTPQSVRARRGGEPAMVSSVLAEARASLLGRAGTLRLLRWLFGAVAVASAMGLIALRRRFQRTQPARPLERVLRAASYAGLVIVLVWAGYLGSLYASHHLRDIDRSLGRLAHLEHALN